MLLGRLGLPLRKRLRNWARKSMLESLDHGPKTGYRPEKTGSAPESVWNGSAKSRAASSVCWTRARSSRIVARRRRISSFSLASCWCKSTTWFSKATVSKVALKLRRPETIFLMVSSGPRSGLTLAASRVQSPRRRRKAELSHREGRCR